MAAFAASAKLWPDVPCGVDSLAGTQDKAAIAYSGTASCGIPAPRRLLLPLLPLLSRRVRGVTAAPGRMHGPSSPTALRCTRMKVVTPHSSAHHVRRT